MMKGHVVGELVLVFALALYDTVIKGNFRKGKYRKRRREKEMFW